MVTGPILPPFEDQRELEEKHQAAAPDAAQLRIIIKKKKKKNVYIRGEIASQTAKGKHQV